jgi:hypothetical protein
MRTRLALCGCLLALAAVPASAHAAQSVSCASPSATVLFWPHGHPAVRGVGFPKIPTPHIEVYAPGAGYPSSNFFLYADARRAIDPSAGCGAGVVGKTGAVKHPKTARATKAITCTAPAALSYDVKRSKKGLTIVGHAGADSFFKVEVRPTGSSFTYDRTACKAAAKPK